MDGVSLLSDCVLLISYREERLGPNCDERKQKSSSHQATVDHPISISEEIQIRWVDGRHKDSGSHQPTVDGCPVICKEIQVGRMDGHQR